MKKPATKQTNSELLNSYAGTLTDAERKELQEEIVNRWIFYAGRGDLPAYDTAAETHDR